MLGIVNTPRLNVRLLPNKNSRALGVIAKGTVLDLLGQKNGWFEINYNHHPAFVFDDYIQVTDRTPARNGVVNTNLLNVRVQPSRVGKILGRLVYGSQVDILSDQNGWLEITFFDGSAFVSRDYVSIHERIGVQHGVVAVGKLNVRSKPTSQASVLGQLLRNTELVLQASLGNWLQITFNQQTAFVAAQHIQITKDPSPDPATPINLNQLQEPSTPSVEIAREDGDRGTGLAPQNQMLVTGSPIHRKVAVTWNSFGGLLQHLSNEKQLDEGCSLAVLCVESSGKGFEPTNNNKMIIRFENHKFWKYWGRQAPDIFHQHFTYDKNKPWTGHQWRPTVNDSWMSFHGSQKAEWQVLSFARGLNNDGALQSISMGAPQIMGFNYQVLGYQNVQSMFDAFEASIEAHITALFDFMSPAMVRQLQVRDFVGFAGMYNGNGQKEKYGEWIKNYYDAYKQLA